MPSEAIEIHGMKASHEILPAAEEELSDLLARASREGAACCTAGGATKTDWGNPPRRFDILLGTTGLQGFADVDADNLTMSVAVGTTVAEARARAAALSRILPLDPGHPQRATIGGVVAAGDQGARAAGYGGLRDVVLGVRATLADGSTVKFGGRTMKNVTGYDMTKLFVGSFGVLGVLTEVTFRLLPRYDSQALVLLPLSSLDEARTRVARILQSYLQALALEVVSADALPGGLALSTAKLPSGAGAMRTPTTAGAPRNGDRPVLLAGFGGHRAAVDRSLREVTEAYAGGATVLRDAEAEAMYEHLADATSGATDASPTSAVTAASAVSGTTADAERQLADQPRLCLRGSVPISRALDLVSAAQDYARANGFDVGYRAGASRGRVDLLFERIDDSGVDGSASAGAGPGAEGAAADPFTACLDNMRAGAVAMGGSLFVTGGSASLSSGYDAWGDVGSSLTLMKRIKERFDPHGVLNAGRFVGGI